MRRALVLAAVAALLVPPLSAPGSAQAQGVLDEIKQRGELRVAGVLYRPFISRRPNGDHVGIDVEVMRLFAQDLGVKLNIVPAEWATAVAGITTKRWDIVPATCVTPARLEVVDFSESYLRIGAIFVIRSDNPKGLTSLEAFNRPTVTFAVPTGSWSESVAKEAAPQATLRGFGQSTSADLVQEVLAGADDRRTRRVRRSACLLPWPNDTARCQAVPCRLCACEGGYGAQQRAERLHREAARVR
jgi:polar amino acid transport system substrate-binding protein